MQRFSPGAVVPVRVGRTCGCLLANRFGDAGSGCDTTVEIAERAV